MMKMEVAYQKQLEDQVIALKEEYPNRSLIQVLPESDPTGLGNLDFFANESPDKNVWSTNDTLHLCSRADMQSRLQAGSE